MIKILYDNTNLKNLNNFLKNIKIIIHYCKINRCKIKEINGKIINLKFIIFNLKFRIIF